MSKSDKKVGKVKAADKKRADASGVAAKAPPNAIRPREFTARVEWTEVHHCYHDIKAVNVTELERQVSELMAKIPRLPECYPTNGYGSRYKLKLYYTRTSSMQVSDIKRVDP